MLEDERNVGQRLADFFTGPRHFSELAEIGNEEWLVVEGFTDPVRVSKIEAALGIASETIYLAGTFFPGTTGVALRILGILGATAGSIGTKLRVDRTKDQQKQKIIADAVAAAEGVREELPMITIREQVIRFN